ncbi:hypothetical protein [Bradyrhizobium hipponense]|nr:hypothetical protein [Bradyrhizobium hipponense]
MSGSSASVVPRQAARLLEIQILAERVGWRSAAIRPASGAKPEVTG